MDCARDARGDECKWDNIIFLFLIENELQNQMKEDVMKKQSGIWLVCIYIFGCVSTGWAVTVEELQERLDEMQRNYEQQLSKMQAEIDQLKQKQAKAEIAVEEEELAPQQMTARPGRFEYTKGNPVGFGNVTVGGYADIEFENFENTNSTYDQARFIINVGAQPHERLVFYSEYEIEHGGTNAAGGGEAKVEQAWMDYLINEAINLRGGIILVPFGKFNLLHDSDLQDLTERPLVVRRVIPSTWQEAGAGLYGDLHIGESFGWETLADFGLNYEVYSINGLDEDISDSGFRNAKGTNGGVNDLNNNKAFVGRLGMQLLKELEVGLNGYYGRFGRSGNSTSNGNDTLFGIGSDITFKKGPFELVGDYAYFGLEDGALVDHDNNDSTAAVTGPKNLKGFYIEPRYHFWPRFLDNTFFGRNFDNPTFTLVSRYDWVEIGDDGDAGIGDNREKRYTIGLNYRPIESWVFKTEYQWNVSNNEVLERGDNEGFVASMAIGF